jgi:DNA-binding response OmpR family regulator
MSKHTPRNPLKSTESVPLAVGQDPDAGADRPRMLVIGTEEDLSHRIDERYRAQGWQVLFAGATRDAVELALDLKPQVVVLDLSLPGLNAASLVRTLRGAVEHDVYVIAIARAASLGADEASNAPVDLVLQTPIDLSALDAFVRTIKRD